MSTKISALTAAIAGNVTDATVLPLVDSTVTTVKVSLGQIFNQFLGSARSFAGSVNFGSNLTINGGQFNCTTTFTAGTYSVVVTGATGVARDIFQASQFGFSNGFTVQYDATSMVYTFADGVVKTAASSTTVAGLRVPHGAAPTSPVNGDVWTTAAGMFVRVNGVTKTVTLT